VQFIKKSQMIINCAEEEFYFKYTTNKRFKLITENKENYQVNTAEPIVIEDRELLLNTLINKFPTGKSLTALALELGLSSPRMASWGRSVLSPLQAGMRGLLKIHWKGAVGGGILPLGWEFP
ncbi:hypothetical protein ACUWCL_28720, partial [Klebsiella pneumoniae]|uniref:hypothetical protein n=1 Tax=Klebsiella pneumoniae TaxID=573 RepID=UPI0040559688